MLLGIAIDIAVGIVMSFAAAAIVMVFIAETRQRNRLRDLRETHENKLRYQGT